MAQKGNIGVTTENIFPVIKKFLYSDHEIFLREMVSNAVDATQKLKTLAERGDFKGELGDLTVRVSLDTEKGTLTISDRGIGMTEEEINKYINQIAFSGVTDFLDKYKDNANAIIGHFGLGFYSSFMVNMDTTVRGIQMEEDDIVRIIKEILTVDVGDGIRFEYESIEPIREEDAYNNFRVHLRAKYGKIDAPMKIDVTTGDMITPATVQYDFPMLFEDKTVPVMAYTLETVLAEKYETIIRRNIGTTRARDYYDLHTLYRSRKSEIRVDVLKAAVLHTAQKRESLEDIKDWKDILKDLREEPQMYQLWDNYIAENKYIGNLKFHVVLDTVEEIAQILNF